MEKLTPEEQIIINQINEDRKKAFLEQWQIEFRNKEEEWVFILYELSNQKNISVELIQKIENFICGKEYKLSSFIASVFLHYKAYFLWKYQNKHVLAQNYLLKALDLLKDKKENINLIYQGRIFDTLGILIRGQSQLNEAALMFRLAIDYKQQGSDTEGLAISYGNLGRLNMELGNFNEAIKYLNLDIQLMESHFPENLFVRSLLLSTLAWSYMENNQLDEALKKYKESKALNLQFKNSTGLFYNEIGLSELALKNQNIKASLDLAKLAKKHLSSQNFSKAAYESSWIQFNIVEALILKAEAKNEEATQCLLKLLAKKTDKINAIQAAKINLALADLCQENTKVDYLKKALEILDKTEHVQLRLKTEEQLKALSKSDFLLHAAGRFAGREHIEQLIEQAGSEGFQGQESELVVLFADIRGFTTLSEKLSPQDLIITLNRFFTLMTKVITDYGGYVDKFIGDAIMAVFSFPKEGEVPQNYCEQALRAALHMREELNRFRITLSEDFKDLDIGIGLHFGKMVSGIIGSPQKRSYTVIGDAVNTASRLEGLTKQLGASLIISEEVRKRLAHPDDFIIRPLGAYRPKGKKKPLYLYDIPAFSSNDYWNQKLKDEASMLKKYHQYCIQNQLEKANNQINNLLNNNYDSYKPGYHLLYSHLQKVESQISFQKWDKVIELVSK